MGSAKSIRRFRGDLQEIKAALKKELVEPVRLEAGAVAGGIRKKVKATDMGRALWGRRRRKSGSNPPLVIKRRRARISASEGGVVGGVDVRGMAALMILGGRTSAHTIGPSTGKILSFGPNEAATGKVRHPGSTIRSRGAFVDTEMADALGRLERRISHTLESIARKALG